MDTYTVDRHRDRCLSGDLSLATNNFPIKSHVGKISILNFIYSIRKKNWNWKIFIFFQITYNYGTLDPPSVSHRLSFNSLKQSQYLHSPKQDNKADLVELHHYFLAI